MGCYLSTPDENVYITEGRGKNYTYATASCQGWRKEQEDAEDCIPNFDGEDSSLFILCDGHGGAEVAKYTVKHLPEMIKNQPLYQKGEYGKALYLAFIEFDALLRKKETLEELYRMAMDEEYDRKDNQSETDGGADSGGDRPISVDSSEPVAGSSSGFSDGPSSSNGRPSTVVEDVDADTLRKEATEPLTEIIKQFSKRSGTLFNPSPVVKNKTKKEGNEGNIEYDDEVGASTSSDKEPEPSSSTSGLAEPSQGSSSQNIKSMKENLLAKVIQRYFANVNDEGDEDDSEYDGSDETESDEEEEDEEDGDDDDDEEDEDEDDEEEDISDSDGAPRMKGDEDGDDEDEEDDDDEATIIRARSKKHKFKKHHRPILKLSKTSSDDDDEEYVDDEDEVDDDSSDYNEDEFDDNRPHERGEKRKRSPKDNGSDYDDEEDEIRDEDSLLPELTPEEREEYSQKLKRNYVADKDGLPRIKGHRPGFDSGCTTIVALIKKNDIYVASVGDSRCILIKSDGSCDVMSYDHKPTLGSEMSRIYGAGGRVNEGRVNGGLNLSRALGDFNYKSAELPPWFQMISPCPDVRVKKLDSVEYILMACDGIWNSMVNNQVSRFIADLGPKMKHNLADINVELFRKCIARGTDGDGTGCDNMTSILVRFDPYSSNSGSARDEGTQGEQNFTSDLKTPIAQESCSTDAPKAEHDEEMKEDDRETGVRKLSKVSESSSIEQPATIGDEKSKSTTIKRRSVRSLDLKISHSSNIEST